jgi:outer membrane protein insertion porin family
VEQLRGFLQLADRNLAGTGRALILRTEDSRIDQIHTLTFREPYLLEQDVTGQLKGIYQRQRKTLIEDLGTYDLVSFGGAASLEKEFSERLTGILSYQYERIRFSNLDDKLRFAIEEEDRDRVTLGSINPSLFYDTRDDKFNPHSGTLSGIVLRLAARSLGSEAQLRKANLQTSWFVGLRRWLVFAASGRVGVVTKFGDTIEVPPSEQFYVGGRSTVRGYAQDQLGIVGETISDETGEAIGGNATVIFNLEARIFLPYGIGLVLFNDRGNVWETRTDVRFDELKQTVGVGLRWGTPVGPLRLDWGYKLDRERDLCPAPEEIERPADDDCTSPERESPWELHFTLGHAF